MPHVVFVCGDILVVDDGLGLVLIVGLNKIEVGLNKIEVGWIHTFIMFLVLT